MTSRLADRASKRPGAVIALLLLTCPLPWTASPSIAAKATQAEQEHSQNAQEQTISYTPPLRGAPASRVGGGTRGSDGELQLSVLAPVETGLTSQSQPTLYWFISEIAKAPVEFAITELDAVEPLLETQLDANLEAGIHAIDLARYGVRLRRDTEYQWSISLVQDAERRSADKLAAGAIIFVEASPDVAARVQSGDPQERAAVYADAGLWYDALMELDAEIAKASNDGRARFDRAALLEQQGLDAAALFESEHTR